MWKGMCIVQGLEVCGPYDQYRLGRCRLEDVVYYEPRLVGPYPAQDCRDTGAMQALVNAPQAARTLLTSVATPACEALTPSRPGAITRLARRAGAWQKNRACVATRRWPLPPDGAQRS